MSKFKIQGGCKLKGEISVKGAKNNALKIIPASLLSKQEITISNLPMIEDVDKSLKVLENLGAKITKVNKNTVKINTSFVKNTKLDSDLAKKFRASLMFVAPTLARFKKASFPHPGGCVIGAGGRPIDIFIDGFKSFNVDVKVKKGFYHLQTKKLTACDFFFPKMSVTATESFLMLAVLAKGKTTLRNCAMEPEIEALADYLNQQGAKIKGAGTPTIIIEGVKSINAGKYKIIPDRIEAGSFAILAAATKSEIKINNCEPKHIQALLEIFKKIGVNIEIGRDFIIVKKSKKIKSHSIKTHEYPGFPTDLQSPYTVLMTQTEGSCIVHETIYDRRLLYVDMLSQMGANITMCDPHRVVVNGPTKLYAKTLTSPDLRAGIALIIAALVADGETNIDNIYQIDRGYENIDLRLNKLGANITRID